MRLTKKDVDCLLTLVEHTRQDLSYGWGGTYGDGSSDDSGKNSGIDKKEVTKALRGIDVIKRLILTDTK